MNVIGLDPGLTGSCAVLNDHAHVFDLPVELKLDGKKMICASAFAPLLKYDTDKYIVALEWVIGRGGWSAQNIFSLGDSFGCLRGVSEALGFKVVYIKPRDWQEYYGLYGGVTGSEKKETHRAKAIELYPDLPLQRKKDHNRADALLIAGYARHIYGDGFVDNLREKGL